MSQTRTETDSFGPLEVPSENTGGHKLSDQL